MTTTRQPTRRTLGEVQIGVSRYDQAASLLVSLLILVGSAVGLMFVIWLTTRFVFLPRSVPVQLVENAAGRGDRAEGYERDFEPPGIEEMPELAEPLIEASLEAVTESVSAVAASLDVLDTVSTLTTDGNRGRGDNRPAGPLGEGDDIIPRWERWEIRWTSASIAAYASQLDFFGIELGAPSGSSTIAYASGLSKGRPDRRTGPPTSDGRLYMTWTRGTLIEFDRTLLRKASIDADKILFHFYPEDVENLLADLEMKNGGGRSVKEFFRTVFVVKPAGRGFRFEVLEQRFRRVGS